jgi:DNA-directed RNA polymerase specialized sigma24 family protein
MGRPSLTPEQRAAKVPAARRRKLVRLADEYVRSREAAEKSHAKLRDEVIELTNGDVSYRDVAAITGLSFQTVHQFVHSSYRPRQR